MSSILSSQGVVMATAMAAAFSGTLILIAFKIQKSILSSSSSSSSQFQVNPIPILRPCLSSGEKKNKKEKKKVRFADDVMDSRGDSEEFRRQRSHGFVPRKSESQNRGMPANRVVLYNSLLRDRVIHRLSCAY